MRIAVALIVLPAVILLGACGGSSKPRSSPSTASTTPVATTAPATTATSTGLTTTSLSPAATTTTTTRPALAKCVASMLKGSFRIVPGSAGAGHVEALVVLTNISSNQCTTFGYVGMQLLGASDTPLPTKVVRSPGSQPVITLTPGEAASALARISPDVPGPGDSQSGACQPVAQGTEITPPNDTHFVVAPGLDSSVCSRGTIDLSPLAPGTAGGA